MSQPTLDRALIAAHFRTTFTGKLTDAQVANGVRLIEADTSVVAGGAFTSYLFGFAVTCQISGYNFTGAGGGVFFPPGVYPFLGALITDDLGVLVTNTAAIYVATTAVYFNLTFFDSSHDVLGVVNAGGILPVGTGGGKGVWSAT